MDFLELSKKRFATRKFSQETISKEDLNYIMESVRMAPSAVNRQPWKFVIVQSGTAKEKLLQCYDPERLSQLFPTPGYEAVAIIPLGHIAPDCPHKEKQRKTLEEITEYI